MFIGLEQQLIKKKYKNFKNVNHIWSYCKKKNPMIQVNIKYISEFKIYKFSFPLKNGSHYATYIKNEDELRKYVDFIVNNYI